MPTLMVRFANERQQHHRQCQCKAVAMFRNIQTAEGQPIRRVLRARAAAEREPRASPELDASSTCWDEESPLFGMNAEDFDAADISLGRGGFRV